MTALSLLKKKKKKYPVSLLIGKLWSTDNINQNQTFFFYENGHVFLYLHKKVKEKRAKNSQDMTEEEKGGRGVVLPCIKIYYQERQTKRSWK